MPCHRNLVRERDTFKTEREMFKRNHKVLEKEIEGAKADIKRVDQGEDEPPLLYCNRSIQASEAYNSNRDRDAEIERLGREIAMRNSIPLMSRAARPHRHEESGKTEILIDNFYDILAPPRTSLRED